MLDFVGDKVPAIDHLLHAVGSVVHPASGAILFAGPTETPTDVPSIVLFALGALTAGSLHATRATIRPASTTLTAGAGNPVLSFAEDVTSAVLSVVAVFAPILGVLLLLVVAAVAVLWWRRIRRAPGAARITLTCCSRCCSACSPWRGRRSILQAAPRRRRARRTSSC